MQTESTTRQNWDFDEGQEIAPGLHALSLLGGGSRFEAYLAWDERLLVPVVAKVLRPHRSTDPDALEGLRAEHSALQALSHPVLPRCFGGDLRGERPHLVLELVEGPRLSTLVRKYGFLPIEQLIPLATQLTAAIQYMAARRMVHLDVKPKNIVMSGPPRLIDLSIGRTFDEAARTRYPVGTDDYMAPEQCLPGDRGSMGPAADVWGIGATLFEAAAGHLPFPEAGGEAAEPADRWPQLWAEPRAMPAHVPPKVAEVIVACLAPEPDARPTAFEVHALFEGFAGLLPHRMVLTRFGATLR